MGVLARSVRMVDVSGLRRTARQVAAEFSEKNVTLMAAGIAYNAFLSLVPTLLLLLVILSSVGGGLEARMAALAGRNLPGPIAEVVTGVFESSPSSSASVVGLVVLVWGMLKVFRGLDTAFSEIYETTDTNTVLDKVADGVIVFVAVVVAVLATVGASAAFAELSKRIPLVGPLTPLVLTLGLVLAFLPLYYQFPDVDLPWSHVVPGAVFAAVGWAAFQAVFQVYLSFSDPGAGSLFGGVIVVVTWLYFSALVLLLGAVINAVLGGHASGKAGGVGQGATGYRTTREERMDPEELTAFLEALRADLAGNDDPRTFGSIVRRSPVDDVGVIEQTSLDGDEREWAVSVRWRAPAAPPDASHDGDP